MKKKKSKERTKEKEESMKKNPKQVYRNSAFKTFVLGLLFIITAIIIFSFIFYFVYLFKEAFVKILFSIIMIGLGGVIYLILLREFIGRGIRV